MVNLYKDKNLMGVQCGLEYSQKKHNQEMQEKEKIARGTYRLFIPIG